MKGEATVLDAERQKLARRYARVRRRLWVLELVAAAVYLSLWASQGWAGSIRLAVQRAIHGALFPEALPWWIELILVAASVGVPWFLLNLPLDFTSGYVLPHRFGLSTQTLRGWWSDLIKGGLLALGLGAPLLIALYAALRWAGPWWWLWAAGGYTLFTVVLATLAPVVLMPIFFKFRPLGDEHAELRQRLLQLAQRAGTHIEGVFTFDMSRRTRAANAALTGLGKTRRIILGDTLISEFSVDEIETVLAHEMAHQVHKDIPLSIAIQSLANLAQFYLVGVGLQWAAVRLPFSGPADPAGLPLLALFLGVVGLATMPASNAFSRWREALADDFSLALTEKPQAFASAMTRLANQNLAEADPERWVVALLYSHPPLRDRIQKAERSARTCPPQRASAAAG